MANGSLVFPPFRGDHFRPDVHSATYRCAASNLAGRVLSLDVQVRAVVEQHYEARVYDSRVLPGNTAVFSCQVPSFVRDLLTVTSWLQDHHFNIYPTAEGDSKHVMLPTGQLHVVNVDVSDGRSSYRCRTLHRLTGRTQESSTAGRIVMAESKGLVAPQLTDGSPPVVSGRRGEDIVLPCVAQGLPPPRFCVQPTDAGVYICLANSTAGAVRQEVRVRVLPEVSAHIVPVSLRVDSGARAEFLCVTAGTHIIWLKDGQRIIRPDEGSQHDDRDTSAAGRLTIESVQREDQGMYQCVASGDGDSVQATAELRLGASRPQMLYRFIEQTLQPGPDVSLKCIATGQPTPQIYWKLDGFPLPHNDRFVIGQYVTVAGDVISHVNISKVVVEDGGTYECAAENRVGRTTHSAPLRIYGLPIVRKMPPISAVAGEPLVVTCPAGGFPIHAVTWEKDGRMLPVNHRQTVHPNGTLTVENLQKRADQGTYTCQARNRQGLSDKGSVDISVMEPPSIYPFSIESGVRLGERLGLQCLVTKGDIPLSIHWLKDEDEVLSLELPALTVRNLGEFSSTLLIEQLSVEHGGRYTCQASNHAATTSHSVMLAVNVPPEITPFAFPKLAEGARVQVACTVHQGDLPLNLTWLKNWSPLPSHMRITPFDTYSSIVSMNSVRRGDSGNYTCVASNSARVTTHTAHLTISVPPEWVVEPEDTNVVAGQAVALHCQADGFPLPTVIWRKGHGKLATQFDELEVSLKNGTLLIQDVKEEDEGYYMCEANNGIGASLSAVVFLTVNALPRFVLSLRREVVRRGEMAALLCEAEGDMPMQIIWHHNGIQISHELNERFYLKESHLDSSAMSQMMIHHAVTEDSGKYVCIASNPFGKDETVVQLSVQDVPEPPIDIRVLECGSRDVKLAWNEPQNGNSPILHYAVTSSQNPEDFPEIKNNPVLLDFKQETSPSAPQPWARITDLQPATTYYFRVTAFNQLGASSPSQAVSIMTEPEVPSGPPRNLAVIAVGPHALHATWNPPEPNDRNGQILGYYLGYVQLGLGVEDRYKYITVKEDDSNRWILEGLRSFTKYKVTVQAFNNVGAGPASSGVIAVTGEAAPSSPPHDVHCSTVTSQSLHMAWSPPPVASRNGVITGYRIAYEKLSASAGFKSLDDDTIILEVNNKLSTVLVDMDKYCNYSVRVTAMTSIGTGPWSESVTCITAEDVPESPASVRVALSSPRSAILGWAPPTRNNGVLTHYNVYEREVRHGVPKDPVIHTVPPTGTHYEADQLREKSIYEWWVTAVTHVGEGPSTPVVSLAPSSRVPAAILSFPAIVTSPWKTDVNFDCRIVGNPYPEIFWTFNSNRIEAGQRSAIFPNGTLRLQSVSPSDAGNYSCNVHNIHHSELLVHVLRVLVPPAPPTIDMITAGWYNVTLQWVNSGASELLHLDGYILHYREVGSVQNRWIETRLPRHLLSYSVGGLDCGTLYEFSLAAYNMVGEGEAGPITEVWTLGDKPSAPVSADAISSSSHALTLHFERWKDGGCPISHFVLERHTVEQNWSIVMERAPPLASYTISGLKPATFYRLRVTAHNRHGATVTVFQASTLTDKGVSIGSEDVSLEVGPVDNPFYMYLRVSLPISVSLLALVLTLTTVAICLRRKPASCSDVALSRRDGNAPVKPESYSVLPKHDGEPHLCGTVIEPDDTPQYDDDIYPYATFQAWKPTSQVSSQRGFQTFVYQGSDSPDVNSYAPGEVEGDEYSRVHSSVQSDAEEYDSPGSDSDGRADNKSVRFQSAYLQSNIRHSRLVSVLESSTSNEASPSPDRRLHLSKNCIKSHSPKKKFADKVCSETKETAFTFPTPVQTPTRTPCKQQEERCETECAIGSPFMAPIHYRV
ncbi:Down syndrome cell adhesion molecule-like protein Dscam2 isoform X2 [Zootermopsis nevadensis]|uniref:Down syndrome cell adhesion molecule-like protein Dscam2 isoform X2 n=1 Tax=Zootermopsis nevadensis TaxID=136037 RepID=UPI000B8E613D|nr:Down syndrome cell adhesion molecule-like protein Dscam2 isoform X2 [Zootermopsis nevadensis]